MSKKDLKIETPRGQVVRIKNKAGNVSAQLTWNEGFGPEKTRDFFDAQKYVDSEVLRLDAPYMPIQTGMLIKSGQLGTVLGEGEVNYIAPYAGKQYETRQSRPYDLHRGGKWFERMKADHKDAILRGAAEIAGGRK